jgi:hypothetical protein
LSDTNFAPSAFSPAALFHLAALRRSEVAILIPVCIALVDTGDAELFHPRTDRQDEAEYVWLLLPVEIPEGAVDDLGARSYRKEAKRPWRAACRNPVAIEIPRENFLGARLNLSHGAEVHIVAPNH